jgi:uncharacterized protein (TIGR00251 family)
LRIPFKRAKDGITVEIKVEPRASKAGVLGVMGDCLKVKLTSPPVDGAANKQLVELLSKEFGIRKNSVKIVKGERSKNKVVKLLGVDSL